MHLAPEPLRVWPRRRLDLEGLSFGAACEPPPLLRSDLRADAVQLGETHVDSEFACADFPLLLDIADIDGRLQRRLQRA